MKTDFETFKELVLFIKEQIQSGQLPSDRDTIFDAGQDLAIVYLIMHDIYAKLSSVIPVWLRHDKTRRLGKHKEAPQKKLPLSDSQLFVLFTYLDGMNVSQSSESYSNTKLSSFLRKLTDYVLNARYELPRSIEQEFNA